MRQVWGYMGLINRPPGGSTGGLSHWTTLMSRVEGTNVSGGGDECLGWRGRMSRVEGTNVSGGGD